MAGMYTTTAI